MGWWGLLRRLIGPRALGLPMRTVGLVLWQQDKGVLTALPLFCQDLLLVPPRFPEEHRFIWTRLMVP